MNTIKTIFATLLIGLFLQSCDDPISGAGLVIQEEREISDFSDVNIHGIFDTKIIHSSENKIIIKANDDLMDRLKAKVTSEVLELRLEEGYYNNIEMDVTIYSSSLESLHTEGLGDVEIIGFSDLDMLELIHGSSGDITVGGGNANRLNIIKVSAGDINAYDFEAQDVFFNVNGVGDVHVTAMNRLNGLVNGVGDLYYKGSPEISVELNGVGSIVDAN